MQGAGGGLTLPTLNLDIVIPIAHLFLGKQVCEEDVEGVLLSPTSFQSLLTLGWMAWEIHIF